jgi:4-amino-4-deoxy-L-arabinose transferase-like glycosyltransferase
LIITLTAVVGLGLSILPDWREMKGFEAYRIAQALAAGEGFSFPSSSRWLFDPVADGSFHPTAWVDPFYTFILAGLIWLFGNSHQLPAAIFNLLLLISVLALTYRLGERLISPIAGVASILILFIGQFSRFGSQMNNTMLAAALVVTSSLALTRFLEKPCNGRAVLLGACLGLTVLSCPGAQLFVPITAIGIIFCGRRNLGRSVPHAALVLLVGAAVILPWTIRNYRVFKEFVPVRNGVGQITFVGVVAAAGTVAPDRLRSAVKPGWRAETPQSAVAQMMNREKLNPLERFLMDYMKAVAPDYTEMNEAQRDKWLLQEAKTFLVANPVLSAQLSIAKLKVFIRSHGKLGITIFILAAIGGLFAVKCPSAMILALWTASYIGPFLLIVCYYGRYRAPVEPLLSVLAVFAAWGVLNRFSRTIEG